MVKSEPPTQVKRDLDGQYATVVAPPPFLIRDNAGFFLSVMQRASYSAILILEHKEISKHVSPCKEADVHRKHWGAGRPFWQYAPGTVRRSEWRTSCSNAIFDS